MRVFFVLLFFFIVSFQLLVAQPNVDIKKHTVLKGETITQIAQKYKVTPYDIYKLNPDAKNGIQENSILLIPASLVHKTLNTSTSTHEVKPKESLYGIAKQYNTTVEQLEKWNPEVKENGLKIGQLIQVSDTIIDKQNHNPDYLTTHFHEVTSKETLYSIAKQYEVSVEDLIAWNPTTSESLSIGQKLIIKKTKTIPITELKSAIKNDLKTTLIEYEVQPKETIFSLSKRFNINQEKLIELNPTLKEGVQVGMKINVPFNTLLTSEKSKEVKDLTKSLVVKDKKELVLLLPFNISSIESDTTLSIQARLKRDGFLNLTLDFYSGALMAIDSAKQLGLNLNVKIFDSQESKKNSAVASIIQNQNLMDADVVIGPFYPQYIEKTVELLNNQNIPVISPLREISIKRSNLFQSMPPADLVKNEMFAYIRSKNGNMIALIDVKKSSSKQFIFENHKDVFIAPLNEKGTAIRDSIVPKLEKERVNYFILETASSGMIFNAIDLCNNAKLAGYQVELVVLDINDTFETHEVFPKIVKQQIIFPSLTRYQDTPESLNFAMQYKKKNNVNPNQYALRGFDIVFDTLLRLFQKEDFNTTIQKYITEGVENKFDYQGNSSIGYSNKGVYIMQYGEEYSIKLIQE